MAEYIDREAVMQKFADHVKRSNNSDFAPTPTWNQAVQIVEDFPAADVVSKAAYDQVAWERHLAEVQLKSIGKSIGEKMDDVQPVKYGEWKFDPLGGDWKCLVCGYHSMEHGNYCPNCGARMDDKDDV